MPLPLQQQSCASWLAALFSLFPLLLFQNAWALSLQNSDGGVQEVVPAWGDMPPGKGRQVSFSITAFGKVLLLQLEPDASFLAPGLKIQHVGRKEPVGFLAEEEEEEEEEEEDVKLRKCFYSGTVNSQPDSLVAVSLCQGIHGSFFVDGDKYIIQPQSHGSEEPLMQVHQLQKRSWSKEAAKDRRGRGAQLEPNSTTTFNRAKRFTSQARYVETLLVADTSMVQFYGQDLTNHILTLMSVAAQIYKHPSLKNSINLVVVKVLVVEDENAGPEVSDNGGLMLRNFCNWQQFFNPLSDRHPEHYDTAILLTRQDFCGHETCRTLGVAETGTMCDPNKSCSVIEDEGLQAAYTLAHELGHVLSMPHDDSNSCKRLFGPLGKHHMMAPLFIHLNKTLPWSPCSAMYITEFLDGGHGNCLLDEPAQPIALPTDLPGQIPLYNLDQQCQQIFGKEFQHCPNATQEDVCSQLWCKLETGEQLCHTKNGSLPWADGTPCGPGKICLESHCVAQDTVMPKLAVDGNWGPWSMWGPCSRTCGGGVHFSYRDCDNPVPKNGGKYCEGQRVQYESCNIEECSPTDKSFREHQCEKYDRYNLTDLNGNLLEWVPMYAGVSPRDRCKLVCRAKRGNEFKVFETKVVDGTTCAPETLSVCVHGQCIKAGCDHIIGSSKKLDKCGVCGGDCSTCRKISGSLNKSKFGYNDIVTIPAGATNIDIKQHSRRGVRHDGNYLALRTLDGKYLLNGNFTISAMEQDIFVKGTVLRYSGSLTTLERLQSYQQLPESIVVQVLTVSSEMFLPKAFPPPKVKYTFFIPKDLQFSKQKVKEKSLANMIKPLLTSQWVLGDWSECSKSCSSGWQRRTVECLDVEGQPSSTCDKALKPEDIKPCSGLPCPIWQMGPWSPCSQTCGEGMRTRSALCIDYLGKPVAFEKCNLSQTPAATMVCVLQQCYHHLLHFRDLKLLRGRGAKTTPAGSSSSFLPPSPLKRAPASAGQTRESARASPRLERGTSSAPSGATLTASPLPPPFFSPSRADSLPFSVQPAAAAAAARVALWDTNKVLGSSAPREKGEGGGRRRSRTLGPRAREALQRAPRRHRPSPFLALPLSAFGQAARAPAWRRAGLLLPPSRGALLSYPLPSARRSRVGGGGGHGPAGAELKSRDGAREGREKLGLSLVDRPTYLTPPPSPLPLSARRARGKEGLSKSRSILNICRSKYTSKMGVKTFTHSSPAHSQEMLGKLNMLRNDGHFCDITIRVQDKIFRAHKVVLAACSDFFRSKLVGQAEDDSQSVLDLHHVTVTGFLPLLEYAYTATLSINTENIIDVLAAASYMQMFSVASTCSEFMKSSILWNTPNSQQEKVLDTGQENSANCNFTSRDGSLSPVSSECSVVERTIPVCRESRRKRKSYIVMSPESPLKCNTQTNSPQVLTTSASFSESRSHPVDSSLAFPWTFPFGIDRRLQSEKVKQVENSRTLEVPGPSEASRRISDYMTCESTKTTSPLVIEEDVRVKVERLSDEEVHEEVSQPVSASQSSLSDQQTVPGSEQVQEDLLISPQSSSIGSIDEGVTEGLPTLQSTSGGNIHVEDDDRLENVQYPYQLYIAPTTSSTERPSPNGPDRPFQCPTCGVRFTRIQNLKQHMLIHSGIKPFQCDRCGKKFTRAYSLKMHRLKHEGKRCFRCQICSATFTSFGEYKHHMRVSRHIIRKPRIYECKTCGAMFTNSGNLIVHLRSLNHEASELANYFQSSDFLVPDYLNQEHEETLGQYELGEHGFESSSSVQMPVISQVSSTQNCESTFPLGPLGGLLEKEEDLPEQPKTISSAEAGREELPKAGLSSITIE